MTRTRYAPRHAAPSLWDYFKRRALWALRHPFATTAPWEAR